MHTRYDDAGWRWRSVSPVLDLLTMAVLAGFVKGFGRMKGQRKMRGRERWELGEKERKRKKKEREKFYDIRSVCGSKFF